MKTKNRIQLRIIDDVDFHLLTEWLAEAIIKNSEAGYWNSPDKLISVKYRIGCAMTVVDDLIKKHKVRK